MCCCRANSWCSMPEQLYSSLTEASVPTSSVGIDWFCFMVRRHHSVVQYSLAYCFITNSMQAMQDPLLRLFWDNFQVFLLFFGTLHQWQRQYDIHAGSLPPDTDTFNVCKSKITFIIVMACFDNQSSDCSLCRIWYSTTYLLTSYVEHPPPRTGLTWCWLPWLSAAASHS